MTGTNIPEGTKSLTRGGYDKLLDQAGIVADARLHDLRYSFSSRPLALGAQSLDTQQWVSDFFKRRLQAG